MVVNVLLPAACFVLSRHFAVDLHSRRWATYSWVTGALILAISIPSTIGLPFAYKAGFPVVDGLIQRIVLFIGWTWLMLIALHLWREIREAGVEAATMRLTVPEVSAD